MEKALTWTTHPDDQLEITEQCIQSVFARCIAIVVGRNEKAQCTLSYSDLDSDIGNIEMR